ncbi:hypothetical protein [Cellulomonas sp. P5_C5]
MTVLQKLLVGAASEDVRTNGRGDVGGVVAPLPDAFALGTPAQVRAVYQLDDSADTAGAPADVVRFPLLPLMTLDAVPPADDLPWPTYPSGFLRSEQLVRVWVLQRTRWPRGAELWRIEADGSQRPLTVYDGAARGWRGATAYRPPNRFVGPTATWNGTEYPADLLDESGSALELVAVGPTPPAGFEAVRPMVSVRTVDRADCEEVQALVVTASWRGLPCRVVDSDGTQARILIEPTRREDVAALRDGAQIEPGIFELTVPVGELADGGGRADVLPRS